MKALFQMNTRHILLLTMVAFAVQASGAMGQTRAAAHPATAQEEQADTLRLWGYDGMGPLLERWENGFHRFHPGVSFKTTLPGPAAAMAGLYTGVADISVMGRELWPNETMAFQWVFQYQPFGVEVVTSSLTSPGQSYSPVVMVNAQNPIPSVTLAQLAGIYGSEHRRGGRNLRVWGDLGLTGAWANRPIHAYGYGVDDALGVYFRKQVLQGDYKPNVTGHLLSDSEGNKAAARILAAVQADPLAIGYGSAEPQAQGIKVLPVAAAAGTPAIPPSAETLLNRSYPLTRSLSFYINRAPGKPLDRNVLEFLRYILSPEGQQMVAADGHFTPLLPGIAEAQSQSLDRQQAAPRKDEKSSDAN